MTEIIMRLCDHCGKDLMVLDESLGPLEGQRFVRVREVRRDLPIIHSMSTDRPMVDSIYCSRQCVAAALDDATGKR